MKSLLSPRRTRAAALLIASTAAVAVPATASASTSAGAPARTAAAFTATMHVPTTTPYLGQTWVVTGNVTKGATKLSGRVRYQMVVLGIVQHTDPWKPFTNGTYKETLIFPKTGTATLAVGLKMTFKLELLTKYGSKTLQTTIVEQKAAGASAANAAATAASAAATTTGPTGATTTSPAAHAAAAFTIVPHIANHTPIINRLWPITLDVTKGKLKLAGSVSYQFMVGGLPVAPVQKGHSFTGGVYHDTLKFPPKSKDAPLTLRILVKTRFGTQHKDWKVTPK